ncbi:MAG TPA: hypothetical protein VK721_15120 [Solirubrobacteraceae bacterium]|nr:hypothetical protein [Solirubrobacteraceae bacterium]
MIFAVSAIAVLSCISTSSAAAAIKTAELVRPLGGQLLQNAFMGDSLHGSKVESSGKSSIACTELTFKGNMSSVKLGTLTMRLVGCKFSNGEKCNTSGQAAGIMIVPWALEVVNKSKEEENEEKDYFLVKTTETSATCGATEVTIKGGFLIPTTPESSGKTTYTFNAKGKEDTQTPELTLAQRAAVGHFELKPLKGGMWEEASLNAEGLETKFEETAVFV